MNTTPAAHKALEAKIAADREAFLAAGGEIQFIPNGVSAFTTAQSRDFRKRSQEDLAFKRRQKNG